MNIQVTRRQALQTGAGILTAGGVHGLCAAEDEAPLIIDCHAHIYGEDEKKYPTVADPYRPPKGKGTVAHLCRGRQAAEATCHRAGDSDDPWCDVADRRRQAPGGEIVGFEPPGIDQQAEAVWPGMTPSVRIVIPDDEPAVMVPSRAFQKLDGYDVRCFDTRPSSRDELVERIGDAEVLINIRSSCRFDGELFARCPSLRMISRQRRPA